jgi:hypothetical protein
MKIILLPVVLLLFTTLANAGGQHVIPDYATAQRQFFWTQLYVNGSKSIYRNVKRWNGGNPPNAEERRRNNRIEDLEREPVY